MSKKIVPQLRQYTASQPGYCIALPETVNYVDPKINRRRGLIKFSSVKGGKKLTDEGIEEVVVGGLFRTDNQDVQDFIENHPAFKQGIINRVPTPEEIAEKERQRAIEQKIQWYKEAEARGLPIDFSAVKDANIRVIAKEVGIETTDDDGKKLTKDEIVDKVKEVLGFK